MIITLTTWEIYKQKASSLEIIRNGGTGMGKETVLNKESKKKAKDKTKKAKKKYE